MRQRPRALRDAPAAARADRSGQASLLLEAVQQLEQPLLCLHPRFFIGALRPAWTQHLRGGAEDASRGVLVSSMAQVLWTHCLAAFRGTRAETPPPRRRRRAATTSRGDDSPRLAPPEGVRLLVSTALPALTPPVRGQPLAAAGGDASAEAVAALGVPVDVQASFALSTRVARMFLGQFSSALEIELALALARDALDLLYLLGAPPVAHKLVACVEPDAQTTSARQGRLCVVLSAGMNPWLPVTSAVSGSVPLLGLPALLAVACTPAWKMEALLSTGPCAVPRDLATRCGEWLHAYVGTHVPPDVKPHRAAVSRVLGERLGRLCPQPDGPSAGDHAGIYRGLCLILLADAIRVTLAAVPPPAACGTRNEALSAATVPLPRSPQDAEGLSILVQLMAHHRRQPPPWDRREVPRGSDVQDAEADAIDAFLRRAPLVPSTAIGRPGQRHGGRQVADFQLSPVHYQQCWYAEVVAAVVRAANRACARVLRPLTVALPARGGAAPNPSALEVFHCFTGAPRAGRRTEPAPQPLHHLATNVCHDVFTWLAAATVDAEAKGGPLQDLARTLRHRVESHLCSPSRLAPSILDAASRGGASGAGDDDAEPVVEIVHGEDDRVRYAVGGRELPSMTTWTLHVGAANDGDPLLHHLHQALRARLDVSGATVAKPSSPWPGMRASCAVAQHRSAFEALRGALLEIAAPHRVGLGPGAEVSVAALAEIPTVAIRLLPATGGRDGVAALLRTPVALRLARACCPASPRGGAPPTGPEASPRPGAPAAADRRNATGIAPQCHLEQYSVHDLHGAALRDTSSSGSEDDGDDDDGHRGTSTGDRETTVTYVSYSRKACSSGGGAPGHRILAAYYAGAEPTGAVRTTTDTDELLLPHRQRQRRKLATTTPAAHSGSGQVAAPGTRRPELVRASDASQRTAHFACYPLASPLEAERPYTQRRPAAAVMTVPSQCLSPSRSRSKSGGPGGSTEPITAGPMPDDLACTVEVEGAVHGGGAITLEDWCQLVATL